MFIRFSLLSLCLLTVNACSHFVKTNTGLSQNRGAVPSSNIKLSSPNTCDTNFSSYQSPYGEIPLDAHPDVDKWIHYFTNKGREYMQTYLERASRYNCLMKSVLQENNLPLDLVYVALIESGFSPKALSRSNAVGYWQFIYGTGKRYGLRIDGYVDERRDPVLSTKAASDYFKRLYSLYESWPLALASYNAGEFRVNRVVLNHYNRDFWFLSSKRALPRETRNYYPKLIAAIHISKNPEKYGFVNLNYYPPIAYETLKITRPISLLKLAKHIGVDVEEIKALNPMYKGEYVPIYENETLIRVPIGKLSVAQASLEKSSMNEPKYNYHYHYMYRVRSGDSLYKIARRHKTTVSKLRRENRLSSSLIRPGQKLRIPTKRLIASKPSSSKKSRRSSNKKFHTVKRGDTLNKIAKRYGLKLAQLKTLNNIEGNPLIHPRQKLRVKKRTLASTGKTHHTVQKGDTLIGISKKYNISLPKLMKANSMTLSSVLLTGTRLIIP